MTRTANRFTKGTALFTCLVCSRKTRDTGRGDNEGVGLCGECYDLAGEENHISDNGGEFYDTPVNILAMIKAIADKGGDVTAWESLKVMAEAAHGVPVVFTAPAGRALKVERIAKYVSRIVGKAAHKAVVHPENKLAEFVMCVYEDTFPGAEAQSRFAQAVQAELTRLGFTW